MRNKLLIFIGILFFSISSTYADTIDKTYCSTNSGSECDKSLKYNFDKKIIIFTYDSKNDDAIKQGKLCTSENCGVALDDYVYYGWTNYKLSAGNKLVCAAPGPNVAKDDTNFTKSELNNNQTKAFVYLNILLDGYNDEVESLSVRILYSLLNNAEDEMDFLTNDYPPKQMFINRVALAIKNKQYEKYVGYNLTDISKILKNLYNAIDLCSTVYDSYKSSNPFDGINFEGKHKVIVYTAKDFQPMIEITTEEIVPVCNQKGTILDPDSKIFDYVKYVNDYNCLCDGAKVSTTSKRGTPIISKYSTYTAAGHKSAKKVGLGNDYLKMCPQPCKITSSCSNGSNCSSSDTIETIFEGNGSSFEQCVRLNLFDNDSKTLLYSKGNSYCLEAVEMKYSHTEFITRVSQPYYVGASINIKKLICTDGTNDTTESLKGNYYNNLFNNSSVNVSETELSKLTKTVLINIFKNNIDQSIKEETENKIIDYYNKYVSGDSIIKQKMDSYIGIFDLNSDNIIDNLDKEIAENVLNKRNAIYFVPKAVITSSNSSSISNFSSTTKYEEETLNNSYIIGYKFYSSSNVVLKNQKDFIKFNISVKLPSNLENVKVKNSACKTKCSDDISSFDKNVNSSGMCTFINESGKLIKKYFSNHQDVKECTSDYILENPNNTDQINKRASECSDLICTCPTCEKSCTTSTGEIKEYKDYPNEDAYCKTTSNHETCMKELLGCVCPECEDGNYFFRNISLNDVFPNSKYDVSGKSLIKFRAIGINWRTTKGKDTQKEIEEAGDKIYNNNNESSTTNNTNYYSFDLTPSSMRKIREYNKKNDYSDFNMTCSIYGTNINIKKCYSNFISDFLNPSKGYIKSSSYDLTELEKARKTFAQYADGSAWK